LAGELEQVKKELEQSEGARRNLQASIIETTNELKKENVDLQNQIIQLMNEKKELIQRNNELQSK